MGNLLACAACNAASCVCNQACGAVGGSCGKAAKKSSFFGRLLYALILLLAAVLAYVLKRLPMWIDDVSYLKKLPFFHGCTPQNSSLITSIIDKNFGDHLRVNVPEQLCYGTMSVYRVSFALALLHLVFLLAMIGVKSTRDLRHRVQHGWWVLKLLALIALLVAAFFIPNSVFVPFGWLALGGSALFILIQLVLLVDFAHTLNETWVGYYEESQGEAKGWLWLLVGSTGLLYALSLTGVILMYVYFTENPKLCWFNPMFITLNVILCVAVSLFSVHPGLQAKNPRIGLLQSAVVTAYCTYLVWSALSAQPASMECSSFPLSRTPGDGVSLWIGLLFTFVALVYAAFRASGEGSKLTLDDPARKALLAAMPPEEKAKKRSVNAPALAEAGQAASSTAQQQQQPDSDAERSASDDESEKKKKRRSKAARQRRDVESDSESVDSDADPATAPERGVAYNYSFFHFTFFLAALYLAMVLTNWESVTVLTGKTSGENAGTILVDQGMASVWVKVVSSWLTLVLYVWSMVAPICCPDREF